MCHRKSTRNKELILTYLIPTRLVKSRTLPSARLLAPYPRLATLFTPLTNAIRSGDLSSFDAALAAGESSFVKRRIYLTLERGRDICLRNLLRKVFVAGGVDEAGNRRVRVPVQEFAVAVRLGEAEGGDEGDSGMGMGRFLEQDEVECLLANMIYKVRLLIRRCCLLSNSCPLDDASFYLNPQPSTLPPSQPSLPFLPLPPSLPYHIPIPCPLSQTLPSESNERLHLPRSRYGRPLQNRRIPRHRRVTMVDPPWCYLPHTEYPQSQPPILKHPETQPLQHHAEHMSTNISLIPQASKTRLPRPSKSSPTAEHDLHPTRGSCDNASHFLQST